MVLRVGLTGGIGSGKTQVARRLGAQGAVVIDADLLAREALAPGSAGLEQVVAEFGSGVLGPTGELDRPALGALVFADPDARRRLEAIVHPEVRRLAAEAEATAVADDPDAIVVHDVPLLVESRGAARFDVVVVVDVPVETQLLRLVGDRQMTEEAARARIAAQATREQRLAVADHVIDNTGTLVDLDGRVAGLWADLVRTGRGGLSP